MGSTWQKGPAWLVLDQSEWPNDHSCEFDGTEITEQISRFRIKSRTMVASSNSVVSDNVTYLSGTRKASINTKTGMDKFGLDALICNCGDLSKLIRCVAYFLRMAGRALRRQSDCSFGKEIKARESFL